MQIIQKIMDLNYCFVKKQVSIITYKSKNMTKNK